ncbi:MAG: hypothetical protein P8M11_10160 [Planctomycetota bacterium]|nr:hypothetical protein [Planctomycetota bacterium]
MLRRLALSSLAPLLLAPCLQAQAPGSRLVARQVAAPAHDIESGRLRLPAPAGGAVRARGALFELSWTADGRGGWRALTELPVGRGPLALALQAHGAGVMRIDLDVAGQSGLLGGEGAVRSDQLLAPGLGGEEVQRWDTRVLRGGVARISVTLAGAQEPPRARLVVRDAQEWTAAAFVDSHELVVGNSFALVAQVEAHHAGAGLARPVPVVDHAWVELTGPSGTRRLRLADDGLSGDGAAGDGQFGARLPSGHSGDFAARVELTGVHGGERFLRTTRVTYTVEEPAVALTGVVSTKVLDARRLRLDVDALMLADPRRLQVSAEVWGRDVAGVARPMTWLSRIGTPRPNGRRAGHWDLSLWLDSGWFSNTGLRPPLELRNVRVQDPDHLGVLAQAEVLPVPAGALPPLAGRGRVEPETLFGPMANAAAPPTGTSAAPIDPVPLTPGLVLSHGYCAVGNPFPTGDFSQPRFVFSDNVRNRSHDDFARRLVNQASAFTSFGVVGHSQGGSAALHLLTYYQSPLDRAQGPRRIQSVGTPYQGTPLASLGFFTCGVNNNMTTSGGPVWLAGIPSWARAEVHYRTTSESGFFACQILTALLLANPEDGTTERSRGQLPGGHNEGHVSGWCHTILMADPDQCLDSANNAVMDSLAAR